MTARTAPFEVQDKSEVQDTFEVQGKSEVQDTSEAQGEFGGRDKFEIKGWCPGALRPMLSGDGLIVRVRPVCASLSLAQMRGIAEAAARFGNGHIDLTRRANLQIRGVSEATLSPLLEVLRALGLIDEQPEAEAVRNILVNPLAGLDPDEVLDMRPLARELAAMLAAEPLAWALPGKFAFALDGGGALPLTDERADIRLTAIRSDGAPLVALAVGAGGVTQWLGAARGESAVGAMLDAVREIVASMPVYGGPRARQLGNLDLPAYGSLCADGGQRAAQPGSLDLPIQHQSSSPEGASLSQNPRAGEEPVLLNASGERASPPAQELQPHEQPPYELPFNELPFHKLQPHELSPREQPRHEPQPQASARSPAQTSLGAEAMARLASAMHPADPQAIEAGRQNRAASRRIGLLAIGGSPVIGLGVPFGRLEAGQLLALADAVAEHGGADGIRLSPWRVVYVPLRDASAPTRFMAWARLSGFVTDAADPLLRIQACPGRPACRAAHADTRQDAASVASWMAANGFPGTAHLSGCAKGCASSAPADLMLVGEPRGYRLMRDATARGEDGVFIRAAEIEAALTRATGGTAHG